MIARLALLLLICPTLAFAVRETEPLTSTRVDACLQYLNTLDQRAPILGSFIEGVTEPHRAIVLLKTSVLDGGEVRLHIAQLSRQILRDMERISLRVVLTDRDIAVVNLSTERYRALLAQAFGTLATRPDTYQSVPRAFTGQNALQTGDIVAEGSKFMVILDGQPGTDLISSDNSPGINHRYRIAEFTEMPRANRSSTVFKSVTVTEDDRRTWYLLRLVGFSDFDLKMRLLNGQLHSGRVRILRVMPRAAEAEQVSAIQLSDFKRFVGGTY